MAARQVLVVEDDRIVARHIARSVKRLGPVRVAATIAEARAAMKTEEFAAATIDVTLPDGCGMAFLAEVRRRFPAMPALVLTGASDRSNANQAQVLGAEFAFKPDFRPSLDAFVRRIEQAPRQRTAQLAQAAAAFSIRHHLSVREREIVALAVAEVPRAEMPGRLGMALNTLKTHTNSLLKRTRLKSLADVARAVRAAVRSR